MFYFQEDPLEPGLRLLPLFYGLTVVVNVFSVFYEGPESKYRKCARARARTHRLTYTHTHTHTQRERERERERERPTHTYTQANTHEHTHR